MANGKVCKLYVSIGDKQKTESKLFKELFKKFGDFNIALMAYTSCKTDAFKALVEKSNEGLSEKEQLKQNEQGEWADADKVITLLNGNIFLETKNDPIALEKAAGVTDANGNTITYTNIQEALTKVNEFNQNNPLYLASVTKVNTEDNIQQYKISVETRTGYRLDTVYYSEYVQNVLSTLGKALKKAGLNENQVKQVINNIGSVTDLTKIVDSVNFIKSFLQNIDTSINGLNNLLSKYIDEYDNVQNNKDNHFDLYKQQIAFMLAILYTNKDDFAQSNLGKWLVANMDVKLDSFETLLQGFFKRLNKFSKEELYRMQDFSTILSGMLGNSYLKDFRQAYKGILDSRENTVGKGQLSEKEYMNIYINNQKEQLQETLQGIRDTNEHVKEVVLQVDKLLNPLHNLLFDLQIAVENDLNLKHKQLTNSNINELSEEEQKEILNDVANLETIKKELNLLLKRPNQLNMYDVVYNLSLGNIYFYLSKTLEQTEQKVAEITKGLGEKSDNMMQLNQFINDSANDIYHLKNTLLLYQSILEDLSLGGMDSVLLNNSNIKNEYVDGIGYKAQEITNKLFKGKDSIFKRVEKVQESLIRSVIDQFVRHQYIDGSNNKILSEQQILAEVNNIMEHAGDDIRGFFMTTSMAKNNNGFIALMGKYIRDYQKVRLDACLKFKVKNDELAMQFAKRLGLSENTIPKTSFMYMGDRIVSNRDHDAYEEAKKAQYDFLVNKHNGNVEKINKELAEWEKNMTEDYDVYEFDAEGNYVMETITDENGNEKQQRKIFATKRVPRADLFPILKLKGGVTMGDIAKRLNTKEESINNYTLIANEKELGNLVERDKPLDALNEDQKWYYERALYLKESLSQYLPMEVNDLFLAPQVLMDSTALLQDGRYGESFKEYWREAFEVGMQVNEMNINQFTADGENTLVGVHVDGSGKKVYSIPVMYAKRLPKEYRGQILQDFTTGLLRLATTAYNYKYMSEIEGTINMMADYAIMKNKNNDVHNIKTKRLNGTEDTLGALQLMKSVAPFAGPFTNEAFIHGMLASMLYGFTLDEKWMHDNHARIARGTKVLLKYSSLTALSVNLKGMIANVTAGEYQMILEAIAGSIAKALGSSGTADFFSVGSFLRASALITTKGVGGLDTLVRNRAQSYHGLLAELLDTSQSTFTDLSTFTYRDTAGHIIAMDYKYGGYGAGEHLLKHTVMLAILCERKVKDKEGKEISLYDAFEEYKTKGGIEQIRLKEGVTMLDGKAIDEAYMTELKNDILDCNQMMHGAMNKEDQSYLKQFLLFRTMSQLRGFVFEYIRHRFAGQHYTVSGRKTEGYYLSVFYFLKDVKDYMNMAAITELTEEGKEVTKERPSFKEAWDYVRAHSTKRRKQNLVKALSETTFALCCMMLAGGGYFSLDDDDDWLTMMFKYQTRRLGMEIASFSAIGAPSQVQQMLNNLIPCWKTVANTFYAIEGLYNGDISEEILKGPHKGENRYLYYLKRKSIPFWGQMNQMINMTTDRDIMKSLEYQMSR